MVRRVASGDSDDSMGDLREMVFVVACQVEVRHRWEVGNHLAEGPCKHQEEAFVPCSEHTSADR